MIETTPILDYFGPEYTAVISLYSWDRLRYWTLFQHWETRKNVELQHSIGQSLVLLEVLVTWSDCYIWWSQWERSQAFGSASDWILCVDQNNAWRDLSSWSLWSEYWSQWYMKCSKVSCGAQVHRNVKNCWFWIISLDRRLWRPKANFNTCIVYFSVMPKGIHVPTKLFMVYALLVA